VNATDLSAADERAFAHALGIALLRQTDLTLLHVSSDEAGDWSGFPAVRKTLERWRLLEPGSAQEDVFAKFGVRVRKLAIESRFPALAVARHLDHQPADLLVVATAGREGVARWLRGSVAEAMARWSRTMTLFVPTDAERNLVSLADGNLTLENVLIPVDDTPDPRAAIEFARRAAEVMSDDKVTITLLHVGHEKRMPNVGVEDGPHWTFARMQREGDPVDEIIAAAELVRADLIVMPTEGRHGVFDALRGSTTERVLRRSRCPVLAVPAPTGD
jgi:nucleotide-binding universal stress UspA family protein